MSNGLRRLEEILTITVEPDLEEIVTEDLTEKLDDILSKLDTLVTLLETQASCLDSSDENN